MLEEPRVRRRVAECTCGADRFTLPPEPHREGCPRYRDRSKAQTVLAALRKRYSDDQGEWLFFEEAWQIDAFVIRCWTSGVGNRRIAFEVKTSRGDFLSEIRKPAKRQNALDLSHQYFFATPAGLVRKDEIPPECGLIEVSASGRTKTVVKAPVREARGLRMSEAVYLMRTPLYRGGLLQLRREILAAQNRAEHAEWYRNEKEVALKRADDLLAEYAGHLVVKGSEWVGAWQPHSWVKAEENVRCYISEVEQRYYPDEKATATYVTVRRLDGKSDWPWCFYSVGEFLRHLSPA